MIQQATDGTAKYERLVSEWQALDLVAGAVDECVKLRERHRPDNPRVFNSPEQ
jgi:hypothetical protein